MTENKELIEKWEDRRQLVLSHMCLVGMMENQRGGKRNKK